MARFEKHLPLFQILKELKGYQRQILIDHLDAPSCNALAGCVSTLLRNGKRVKSHERKRIGSALREHNKALADITSTGKSRSKPKKRALATIGGNPLLLILSTAIPMLLDMITKR